MKKRNVEEINKTKYRYLMDNLEVFPLRNIITYTVPVEKEPKPGSTELNRDYPSANISNVKLVKMINDSAKALIAAGVKKGDLVTMVLSNSPETVYIDYALSKIGAAANYIYPNSTAEVIKSSVNQTDSKLLFMLDEPEIRNNVINAIEGTDIKTVVSVSAIESFPTIFKQIASKKAPNISKKECDKIISWQEFIKAGNKIKEVQEASYEDNKICSLMRTSGTSSAPKSVMMSDKNYNAIVRNYDMDKVIYEKGKKLLQTIPLFVAYGNTTSHVMLCNNVGLIIIPEMDPRNFPGLVMKFKPPYSFATPSHARELMKSNEVSTLEFLEILGLGGDGFDDIEQRLNSYLKSKQANIYACNGYGSTEVSAVAISNSNPYHKEGSVGVPVGKTVAKIFEPDTYNEITEIGKIGELAISGDTVTLGYYKDEEETKKVYRINPNDGKVYVFMGDLAKRDSDNFFYYEGRLKNVIARQSFKFAPKEIEDVIISHPKVSQCLVVPKYSKEEGQVPSAHIVLSDYSDLEKTMSEIINMVNDQVEEFHRPTDYKIREDILRTRNNKNDIMSLRIEDTASMYPGVISSNITKSLSSDYDYDLCIEVNEQITEEPAEILLEKIKSFTNDIMLKEKIAASRINYNLYVNNKKYSDSKNNIKENGKFFVKHM